MCEIDWDAVIGIGNIVTALVAVIVAVYALKQTERHKVVERRPWFIVESMSLVTDPPRLVARIKHVSGGVALKLRFSISIAGQDSSETTELPALAPGDALMVKGPRITSGQFTQDTPVTWVFRFEDEFRKKYRIEAEQSLAGKQFTYLPVQE